MLKYFIAFSKNFLAEMVRKEGKSGNTKFSCTIKALKDFIPQSLDFMRFLLISDFL